MTTGESQNSLNSIRIKINELLEDLGAEPVEELAQSFVDDAPGTFAELKTYLEQKDVANLGRTAHSFKAIAQIYGLEAAANLAQEIEQACIAEKIDDAAKLVPLLQDSTESSITDLVNYLREQHQILLKRPQ